MYLISAIYFGIISFWGLLTLIVCAVGLAATAYRAYYFFCMKGIMQKRLAKVFISDATLYLVTLLFGVATLYGYQIDFVLYPLRVAFLSLNIWFGLRLTSKLPPIDET